MGTSGCFFSTFRIYSVNGRLNSALVGRNTNASSHIWRPMLTRCYCCRPPPPLLLCRLLVLLGGGAVSRRVGGAPGPVAVAGLCCSCSRAGCCLPDHLLWCCCVCGFVRQVADDRLSLLPLLWNSNATQGPTPPLPAVSLLAQYYACGANRLGQQRKTTRESALPCLARGASDAAN